MELYSFARETSKAIEQHGSVSAVGTHLAMSQQPCTLVCIRLTAQGILGAHQATQNQLFLVVEGQGRVSGQDGTFRPISAGQAAFWRAGELHETQTDTGLTAIVLEGQDIMPGKMLQWLQE